MGPNTFAKGLFDDLHWFTPFHSEAYSTLLLSTGYGIASATPETATSDVVTLFNSGMHAFCCILASPSVSKEAKKE